MKEMLEEYGGIIAAVITALVIVGLLFAMFTPGNPIYDGVRELLTASMP